MRALFAVAMVFVCLASGSLRAQDTPPLGQYHFDAALNLMLMQHVTFESDDAGIQFLVAGYRHVGRDWYAGLELGAGGSMTLFGDESSFTSIEANAKKVFAAGRVVRFDLGGGLSLGHVSFEENHWFSDDDIEVDEWVVGMQALANLHLKLGSVLLGGNLKYMLTTDVPGITVDPDLAGGWDYSNLTIGLHAGFLI
jgi:hypothetical protein